jgi:hypothetical protein
LNFVADSKGSQTGQIASYTSRPTNVSIFWCIKYEPTYYAVNQYGGFCQEVLFEGSANTTGTYTLLNSIDNYDEIICYGQVYDPSKSQTVSTIITKNMYHPPVSTVGWDHLLSTSVSEATRRLVFSVNANTLKIDEATQMALISVVGRKGSIPTLLSGGEF